MKQPIGQKISSFESLERAARQAVYSGLKFVDAQVSEQGLWRCQYFAVGRPSELVEEENPFVGALGILRLDTVQEPIATAIAGRSRQHILNTMEFPGLWRYWPSLPVDMDTSSICALAAGVHPWLIAGWNERFIAKNRDQQGRFLTWIFDPKQTLGKGDVDAVVNANVVACLGGGSMTREAQQWLVWLLRHGQEEAALHYYWDKMDLYSAMAQARTLHDGLFEGTSDLLLSKIQECRSADGSYGDTLRTAMALWSFAALGKPPEAQALNKSIECILDQQQEDGGWPASRISSGPMWPEAREYVFISRAYDTACCVAVLHGFLKGMV